MWLVPSQADASYFDLPLHFYTLLYRRDLKVSLSEPRLRDEQACRVGDGPVEWTDACILQPSIPFDTSCPVTVFEASPQDMHTFTTDVASIKQLKVTVTDAVDNAKIPWLDAGFTHLTKHFHRTQL